MNATDEQPPTGRLRRIIAFPLTLLVLGVVLVALTGVIVANALRMAGMGGDGPVAALRGVLIALSAVLAYKGFMRWIERAPDAQLALPGAARELGWGLLAGFLLFNTIADIVMALGGFTVLGLRGIGQLWAMLGMAIFSGVLEEVLFRGLILRHLERLTGTWGALALTSAFFGAAHLGNDNATWFAAFAIALEAGLLLGAAYLLTRRLWLAIGIHAAWNFTQGWVFSVPVSGSEPPLGMLITRTTGPDWLTGGAFGLEASVVAMVVATLAGVAMMWIVVRRGGIVPPPWQRGD